MPYKDKDESPEESYEQMENLMMNLVKKGIMEQYTGEDGEFYFGLTELGREIAKDLKDMKERGENYLGDDLE